jgi:hypothetical protein
MQNTKTTDLTNKQAKAFPKRKKELGLFTQKNSFYHGATMFA